eukprot:8498749-Alexandrium_andersonii.AAC.1
MFGDDCLDDRRTLAERCASWVGRRSARTSCPSGLRCSPSGLSTRPKRAAHLQGLVNLAKHAAC